MRYTCSGAKTSCLTGQLYMDWGQQKWPFFTGCSTRELISEQRMTDSNLSLVTLPTDWARLSGSVYDVDDMCGPLKGGWQVLKWQTGDNVVIHSAVGSSSSHYIFFFFLKSFQHEHVFRRQAQHVIMQGKSINMLEKMKPTKIILENHNAHG